MQGATLVQQQGPDVFFVLHGQQENNNKNDQEVSSGWSGEPAEINAILIKAKNIKEVFL